MESKHRIRDEISFIIELKEEGIEKPRKCQNKTPPFNCHERGSFFNLSYKIRVLTALSFWTFG